jgi:hypothetical protein
LLVIENSKSRDFLGEIIDIGFSVCPTDSQKNTEAGPRGTNNLFPNSNLAAFDPLDDSTHGSLASTALQFS